MNLRLSRLLPKPARRWLVRQTRRPRVGGVGIGQLRRVTPISRSYGGDRGRPIDRYYIERFLDEQASDVRGVVLEVGADNYTRRFGADRVERCCVVDIDPENARADYVADLAEGTGLPSSAFDCVICTQTLQLVYDLAAACATLHRILRPAGTLLLTVPGITQVDTVSAGRTGDYWRFSPQSARRLLLDAGFADADLEVRCHGNVLTSICFLHGLAAEELTGEELDHRDESYPMLIVARASKAREAR